MTLSWKCLHGFPNVLLPNRRDVAAGPPFHKGIANRATGRNGFPGIVRKRAHDNTPWCGRARGSRLTLLLATFPDWPPPDRESSAATRCWSQEADGNATGTARRAGRM